MKPHAAAAKALLASLISCDPLVVAAAGRELTFRIKTGKIRPSDGERVAQKLRLLGWVEDAPLPVAPQAAAVVVPFNHRRPFLRLRCRLCHETIEIHAGDLSEADARRNARQTALRFHGDSVDAGPKKDCLGILDALGIVYRRPPA